MLIRTLVLCCFVATTNFNSLADQRTEQVDELFARWDKPDSPGAALGIIQNGELIYSQGYGLANLEHRVAIDEHSVFYIASVSKQFTAACIALLVGDGKISLDDDIRKYVPELPEYSDVVTVRHLVHHTSGIKDYLSLMAIKGISFKNVFPAKRAMALIASQKELNYPPGDQYRYSNSGYLLMAQIVERVTGKSFREFSQERIFAPLEMEHTFFHDDHLEVIPNRVTGYERKKGKFRLNAMQNFDNVGSGGLRSCIADLVKWDQNFYDPKVGGEEFLNLMQTRGTLKDGKKLAYAFGLVLDRYKGLPVVRHGGSMMGFRTHMLRFPEQKFTVFCLGNVAQLNPGELSEKIADIYLTEPIHDSLQEYEGKFHNESLATTYTVSVDGIDLWVESRNGERTKVGLEGEETFSLAGMDCRFGRDASGHVATLSVGISRAGETVFQRQAN